MPQIRIDVSGVNGSGKVKIIKMIEKVLRADGYKKVPNVEMFYFGKRYKKKRCNDVVIIKIPEIKFKSESK